MVIELTDFHAMITPVTQLNLGRDRRVFNCKDEDGLTLDLGDLSAEPSQRFIVPSSVFPGDDSDPSWLGAIAVTQDEDQLTGPHCADHTYAVARLDWTIPDVRPGLHVQDEGARAGAEGDVTMHNGTPVVYRVASGDTLTGIAKRFAITVDDLLYLNPERTRDSSTAYADEILNLSRAGR